MKLLLTCALLMPLTALAATASKAAPPPDLDISGTWSLSGDVQGTAVTETCRLQQNDVVLSGQCDTSTGKYDVKGKLDGRTATFTHGGNYQGSDLVITYTGKVAQDGSMTGTIDVDPFNVTGSFSAKKGGAETPSTPTSPPTPPAS